MKTHFNLLTVTIVAVLILMASPAVHAAACSDGMEAKVATAASMQQSASSKEDAFRQSMRTLWEEHVVWTRLFIISATENLPDKAATTERLLRNQSDIGNAIKPYYGEAAAAELTGLLEEHILIAAEIVTAASAGNDAQVASASQRWNGNAGEIAAFLATANPDNWPEADMRMMMTEHLKLTTTELQARLAGDWAAEIASFEEVQKQAAHMADGLSSGIIAQFPAQFE